MMDLDSYPHILTEEEYWTYAEVWIRLRKCSCCKKLMYKPGEWWRPERTPLEIAAQIKKAGWVHESNLTNIEGLVVCEECQKDGKLHFRCALCEKVWESSEIQEEIAGDPSEFFCKVCYETIPAKVWIEKVEEAEEKHRYDFT